ncbi:MAG: hypothetical protein Q7J35_14125 [Candidatus Methanoperedens sp.]|nr:hypothetical protein [Candidatus Methanoperedens sp.]
MTISDNNPELFEILRAKLNLSDGAVVKEEQVLKDTSTLIRVDMVIEDGNNRYLVEVKSKASIETIAQLVLLKELFRNENQDISGIFLVIAGNVFTPEIEKIANQTNIILVTIPRNIEQPAQKYDHSPGKIKVTSEKSWKVITRLLAEKMTSIRQLSLLENVSYGWAHATIKSLLSQGVVTRKENYVSISDANKLLNGVAWERPFENLFADEINIEYQDAFKAASDISHILKNNGIKFAFTSYTAAGLYTGYAIRHDAVYLYLEKNEMDFFKNTFRVTEKQGIKARIYAPDRDVFADTREKEGIMIVSPSQSLLDLAGLGYSGRDITKAMVDKYATL